MAPVDTSKESIPVQLSGRERQIIAYCAALRHVPYDVIPDADWVRLVDSLVTAIGIGDIRRECAYCRHWEHVGAVSGEDHGRGRCDELSYEGSAGYWLPAYVGEWDPSETSYAKVSDVQDVANVFTTGDFCCSHFRPRKVGC